VELKDVGLGDLYTAWLIAFTLGFSLRAFIQAENSEAGLAEKLGVAVVFAAVLAALFTAVMWIVIRVAS